MTDNINEVDDGELDELDAEILRCAAHSADKKQKPSKEDLCKLLTCLTQDPVYAHAMRVIKRQPDTIFLWAKLSREGDKKFLVRWPDPNGAEIFLHDGLVTARSIHLANFEAALRRDCSTGTPRVLRNQHGDVCYEVDHGLVAEFENNADAARAAGIKDPFFTHDQDGARVPVIVFDLAPAALRQHVARSVLGPQYNPSDRREVDNKHSGGVMIVRATAQGDDAKKVVPAYAREKMAEAPAKPMSELQRDLLTRLEDLRSRPDRATGRPSGVVDVGSGSAAAGDPVERTGDGAGKAA